MFDSIHKYVLFVPVQDEQQLRIQSRIGRFKSVMGEVKLFKILHWILYGGYMNYW